MYSVVLIETEQDYSGLDVCGVTERVYDVMELLFPASPDKSISSAFSHFVINHYPHKIQTLSCFVCFVSKEKIEVVFFPKGRCRQKLLYVELS